MDTHEKILSLIKQGETNEVEFKSAKGGLPASLWESYSAFANTDGGAIVLGVKQEDEKFKLDNLSEEVAKRYVKNFWDCAHNKQKVSVCLPQESDVRVEKIDDSFILVCNIPRASYNLRPVYIGTNPLGHTYRRNAEGDYRCTDDEVKRMFADAELDRYPQDARVMKGYKVERDIDVDTLHRYRRTFSFLQHTHPWAEISDFEFLNKIGAYATEYETGNEGLTAAGVVMFGKYESIINVSGFPRYFVDYREKIASDAPNLRWTDRIYPDGTWEANLYQFYVRVYNRLIQSLPRPFILKGDERQEETPAHDAVREALINCIIHQDLSAMGNVVVERTDDALIFSNPGVLLVSKQQYFMGGRSICRNPTLQKMFMLLGRAEKVGSGVDKILSGWEYLHLPTPTVEEKQRPDYVTLTMVVKTPQENPTRKSSQRVHQTTSKKREVRKTQQENPTRKPHKKTPQENPTRKPHKKDITTSQILGFCIEAKSFNEIIMFLKLKDRKNLMKAYIKPMLQAGLLSLTEPDNPRSRNQKYVASKK